MMCSLLAEAVRGLCQPFSTAAMKSDGSRRFIKGIMNTLLGHRTSSWLKKPAIVIMAVLVALVIGFFIYTRVFFTGNQLVDVCEILESQGYSCNASLSGMYRPGDIVQITEATPDGKERALAPPVVFLWGADCFPEKTPRVAPFTLPQTSGTSTASIGLGANMVSGILPSLKLDSAATIDYNLKLENVTVQTLAKGDLSGKLSLTCVDALERQTRGGDKPGWFSVILESVIADKLLLVISWKADTNADARASIVRSTKDDLTKLIKKGDTQSSQAELNVGVKSDDTKHTVIETHGSVVLGYRARSMQRNTIR